MPGLLLTLRVGAVAVLAAVLAVLEAFHVAARPFGTALPVAAGLAVLGNLALGPLGARAAGRIWGAAVPGVVWLLVVLALSARRAEGDVVVTNTTRGTAFLLLGTAAAALAVAISGGRGRSRATPSALTRR
jgi:hypothetical protein